jgi:amino acid permease
VEASEHPSGTGVTAASPVAAEDRPTGPVAAALIAVGIGALVLAILVVWAESSESFKESLAYTDDVGPLAGKTIWAVVAYVVSWLGLHLALRKRDIPLKTAVTITAVLLALAFVGTFSPFFEMFAPEE